MNLNRGDAMAKRIQLKRTKGWRMPKNCVKVTRPGVFGNPFTFAQLEEAGFSQGDRAKDAEFLVKSFKDWLVGRSEYWCGPECDAKRAALKSRLEELRGKDLACWCKPGDPCHADVLLELANGEPK